MSSHRPAHFRIFRLDDPRDPEGHYRAFWRIDGQSLAVHVWSQAQWRRLPPDDRPDDAFRLEGPGWMTLRPMARAGRRTGRLEVVRDPERTT
jgi:hypothetical protein